MRKKITINFMLIFLFLGGIGLVLRSIRNQWIAVPVNLFELMNNNFTVAIEHLFAGIGFPAGITALFLSLTLFGGKKSSKYIWQSKVDQLFEGAQYYWLVVMLGVIVYTYHIFEHETKQTTESGYWGAPYAYINEWQVLVGIGGVIVFLVYSFMQSRHNKAN